MNVPMLIAKCNTKLKLGIGILGPDGVCRIETNSYHMPDFRVYVGHFDFLKSANDKKSIVGLRLWVDVESDIFSHISFPLSSWIETDYMYFISIIFGNYNYDEKASSQYSFLNGLCIINRKELILATQISYLDEEELSSIQKFLNWA